MLVFFMQKRKAVAKRRRQKPFKRQAKLRAKNNPGGFHHSAWSTPANIWHGHGVGRSNLPLRLMALLRIPRHFRRPAIGAINVVLEREQPKLRGKAVNKVAFCCDISIHPTDAPKRRSSSDYSHVADKVVASDDRCKNANDFHFKISVILSDFEKNVALFRLPLAFCTLQHDLCRG